MLAAAIRQEETVNFLLSKGADPHLKDFLRRNLLHAAAEGGNTSIVKIRLSCDIDIDSKDDKYSTTFLPLGTLPFTAVPTTGHGKELRGSLPYRQGKKGEKDAQFELIFEVNVIETCSSLCSAIKPRGKLIKLSTLSTGVKPC